MRALLALLCVLAVCAAQKNRRQPSAEWDYRAEAVKVNTRGCSNLTLVLDNWKFAIMSQVKDLLLKDHSTVLPDYSRIQSMSDAVGDLYKEFNSLKERLGELTTKFDGVETFVDDMRAARAPTSSRVQRPSERAPPPPPAVSENPAPSVEGPRQTNRRPTVLIKRPKKPDGQA